MTKIEFKGTGGGFEPDIRPPVIQRPAVRPDMRDDDVVMRIDVPAAPALPAMFPDEMSVVLGPHGSEDTRDRLIALLVGHGLIGGQAEMVTGYRRA